VTDRNTESTTVPLATGETSSNALIEAVDQLQSQRNIVQQNFRHEVEDQGWIGQSVDFLKSFVQPEQSTAGLKKSFDIEQERLTVLRQAAELGDVDQFNKTYLSLTGSKYTPHQTRLLKTAESFQTYHDSQQTWVDGTANGVAMMTGVMLSKKLPGAAMRSALSLATTNAIATGTIKTALKATDGQFSDPGYDFGTGAVLGSLAIGSELAGTAATLRMARAYGLKTTTGSMATAIVTEGQGLGVKYLSSFGRFGVPYGVYSGVSPWTHETINSLYYGRSFDLKGTAINSAASMAGGFAGGTLLGFGMSKLPPGLYGFFN